MTLTAKEVDGGYLNMHATDKQQKNAPQALVFKETVHGFRLRNPRGRHLGRIV
jgi:hypothetical protein